MTLVELLVVLAILAGLTAAVMTGAAATREKGRYDQTTRDAEAMAEALSRPDGLSLVSDLGFVPADANALCLLFGARLPHETVTEDPAHPGEMLTNVTVHDIPAWRTFEAPLIPETTEPTYNATEITAPAAANNALSKANIANILFFVPPTSASLAAYARLSLTPDVNTSATPAIQSRATAAPAMVTGADKLRARVEI